MGVSVLQCPANPHTACPMCLDLREQCELKAADPYAGWRAWCTEVRASSKALRPCTRGGGGGRGSVPGMTWQYVLSRCNGPFQLLPGGGGGGSVCGSNFCLAIASYAEKAVASASSGAVLKAFVRLGCVAEWQTGQLHLSRTSMPGLVLYVQNATHPRQVVRGSTTSPSSFWRNVIM